MRHISIGIIVIIFFTTCGCDLIKAVNTERKGCSGEPKEAEELWEFPVNTIGKLSSGPGSSLCTFELNASDVCVLSRVSVIINFAIKDDLPENYPFDINELDCRASLIFSSSGESENHDLNISLIGNGVYSCSEDVTASTSFPDDIPRAEVYVKVIFSLPHMDPPDLGYWNDLYQRIITSGKITLNYEN